jgi:pimeloyl-ACP methyl ester carboxylesterase
MSMVEVDGYRVAYERVGAGPPLLLLHGYVGDGASTWWPQLDALSDDFTVIAWDAPGAGRSSDPPERFGMAGYAHCLARFVDRLAVDKPHVVGLSFGGALAIEFCRLYPAVPSTLTLVGAYAGWAGSLPAETAEQRLRQALELSELSPDEFVDTLLPTMFAAQVSSDAVDALRAAMLTFHAAGFRAMARAAAEDLRGALPYIDVPTLLIYGADDIRAPLSVADRLHRAIRSSTLVRLPGVGHVCNIEAPDAFNATIREFLCDRRDD